MSTFFDGFETLPVDAPSTDSNDERNGFPGSCYECRFWDSLDERGVNGECRRKPPVLVQRRPILERAEREELAKPWSFKGFDEHRDGKDFYACFPETDCLSWCGEFLPRFVTQIRFNEGRI